MNVDLEKDVKITRYKLIMFVVLCLALGSGLTLLNTMLGIVVFAICILVIILPFVLELAKLLGDKEKE